MLKQFFLIFLFLFSIISFSQNEINKYDREKGLYVNAGLDYRITAMYSNGVRDSNVPFADIRKQSSGAALFYELEYFPWTELSVNFQNSFHYTLHYYEGFESNESIFPQTKPARHKLFIDYHVFFNYYFELFEESEFFARLGVSVLNTNSNYSNTITEFGEETTLNSNFTITPLNIGIGFKKNRVALIAGMYTTTQTPYFEKATGITIPYLNLTYTIGKIL